ncbi:MAG: hypothetical protein AB7F64_01265 [Gammaproteobacteria bacterium]
MGSVSNLIDHIGQIEVSLLKLGQQLFDPDILNIDSTEKQNAFEILETDIEAAKTYKQIFNLLIQLQATLKILKDKTLAEVKKDWHFYYQVLPLLKQIMDLYNSQTGQMIFFYSSEKNEFGQAISRIKNQFKELGQHFSFKVESNTSSELTRDNASSSETERYIQYYEEALTKSGTPKELLVKKEGLYVIEDTESKPVKLLKARHNTLVFLDRCVLLKENYTSSDYFNFLDDLNFLAYHLNDIKTAFWILDENIHNEARQLFDTINCKLIQLVKIIEEVELKNGFKEGVLSTYLTPVFACFKDFAELAPPNPTNEQYPFTYNKTTVRLDRKVELEKKMNGLMHAESKLLALKQCLEKYSSANLNEISDQEFLIINTGLIYLCLDETTKDRFLKKIYDAKQSTSEGLLNFFLGYVYAGTDILYDIAGWSYYTVIMDRIDEQLELIEKRKCVVLKQQNHLLKRSLDETTAQSSSKEISFDEVNIVDAQLRAKYEANPFDLSWIDIPLYKKSIYEKRRKLIELLLEKFDPSLLKVHFPEFEAEASKNAHPMHFTLLPTDSPAIKNFKLTINTLTDAENLLSILEDKSFVYLIAASKNIFDGLTGLINQAFTLDIESLAFVSDLLMRKFTDIKENVASKNDAIENLRQNILLPGNENTVLGVESSVSVTTTPQVSTYSLETMAIVFCLQKAKKMIEENISNSKDKDKYFIMDQKNGLYKHQVDENPVVKRNIALYNTLKQINDIISEMDQKSLDNTLAIIEQIISIVTKIKLISNDLKQVTSELKDLIHYILKSLHETLGNLAAAIEEFEIICHFKEGTLTHYIDSFTSQLIETDKYLGYQPDPIDVPPFLIKRQLARDKIAMKTNVDLGKIEDKIIILTHIHDILTKYKADQSFLKKDSEYILKHMSSLSLSANEKTMLTKFLSNPNIANSKSIDKVIESTTKQLQDLDRTKRTLGTLKVVIENRPQLIDAYSAIWIGASPSDMNIIAKLQSLRNDLDILCHTNDEQKIILEPVLNTIQNILERKICKGGFSLHEGYNNILMTLTNLNLDSTFLHKIIEQYTSPIPSCLELKELSAVAFTFRTFETRKVDAALLKYENQSAQFYMDGALNLSAHGDHIKALEELQKVVKKWLTVRDETTSSRVAQMRWLDSLIERKLIALKALEPTITYPPAI